MGDDANNKKSKYYYITRRVRDIHIARGRNMFICMHMDIAHAHMHWTIGHTMFRFLSYSFFIEKIYKQL